MSTTKPVVADKVMVSVVSARQDERAASRDCTTAIWPNGGFSMRTVASARVCVGQGDVHDAGAGAEGGERLRRTEQVDQAAADGSVGSGRGGRHHALGIGQEEAPSGAGGPGRQRLRQYFLRPLDRVGRIFKRLLQALGGEIGDRVERDNHVAEGLAAVIERLHHGADADGGEKGDDQHRHRAAQQWLGGQQPSIRRLGNRLREALDGIGMCRRTRRTGARHRRPPFGFPLSPNAR